MKKLTLAAALVAALFLAGYYGGHYSREYGSSLNPSGVVALAQDSDIVMHHDDGSSHRHGPWGHFTA